MQAYGTSVWVQINGNESNRSGWNSKENDVNSFGFEYYVGTPVKQSGLARMGSLYSVKATVNQDKGEALLIVTPMLVDPPKESTRTIMEAAINDFWPYLTTENCPVKKVEVSDIKVSIKPYQAS